MAARTLEARGGIGHHRATTQSADPATIRREHRHVGIALAPNTFASVLAPPQRCVTRDRDGAGSIAAIAATAASQPECSASLVVSPSHKPVIAQTSCDSDAGPRAKTQTVLRNREIAQA
jgi:hypothetical protein